MGRTNNVILLEGNGDGTFMPFASSPINLPDEKGYCPIVAADFNGDGFVDLAVAYFGQPYSPMGPVYIYLGDGQGSFTCSSQANVGGGPFAMVALDYNGDGITDLAVANTSNISANPPNGSVTVLKGKGDGTFSTFATIPVGQVPNDIVTADFNGDGHPDLAIPNSYEPVPYDPQVPGTTTILLNTVTQTATAELPKVVLIGAGNHVVQATYPANTAFAESSGTIDLQGLVLSSTLTLSANPIEQMITMPVTFTAQVGPASSIAPTGRSPSLIKTSVSSLALRP